MHLKILFFFFNDTATTEIYTLSLHDALPIYLVLDRDRVTQLTYLSADRVGRRRVGLRLVLRGQDEDRKSTRLNSSHDQISYAVFCLKKKMLPLTARKGIQHTAPGDAAAAVMV